MDHNISLITTIAAGFGVALILGFIAERIKLPALVGYLVAGIIIGPATPGLLMWLPDAGAQYVYVTLSPTLTCWWPMSGWT